MLLRSQYGFVLHANPHARVRVELESGGGGEGGEGGSGDCGGGGGEGGCGGGSEGSEGGGGGGGGGGGEGAGEGEGLALSEPRATASLALTEGDHAWLEENDLSGDLGLECDGAPSFNLMAALRLRHATPAEREAGAGHFLT